MNTNAASGPDQSANFRTDCYVLLASLLSRQPSEGLRDILRKLQWDEAIPGGLDHALAELRRASEDYSIAAMKEEFDRLFVGLGCGETIPYASWYREKMIQGLPLVPLRSDLISLGIVRRTDNHEPEDHAAALCEVMAIISRAGSGLDITIQAGFFQQHIASWMGNFFQDLQAAKSAGFYRAVGLFGSRFLEFEAWSLKCNLCPAPKKADKKRRRKLR